MIDNSDKSRLEQTRKEPELLSEGEGESELEVQRSRGHAGR